MVKNTTQKLKIEK